MQVLRGRAEATGGARASEGMVQQEVRGTAQARIQWEGARELGTTQGATLLSEEQARGLRLEIVLTLVKAGRDRVVEKAKEIEAYVLGQGELK
jgi:hypothetical protein